jgi:hypothetical protein
MAIDVGPECGGEGLCWSDEGKTGCDSRINEPGEFFHCQARASAADNPGGPTDS